MQINNSCLLFLLAALFTAFAHTLLKIPSLNHPPFENKNIKISFLAYSIFGLVTFLTIIAYRDFDLDSGVILSTSSYVFIMLFSHFILHEKIRFQDILGSCLVLAGIIFFFLN